MKDNLMEKFKARCKQLNLNPKEVLNSEAINEMVLISQEKPKLFK